MGFGFNLFFTFILLPVTGVLLILWLLSREKKAGKALGIIWLGILGLVLLTSILHWLGTKPILEKSDYYGEYIIDRDQFPGAQADWQYDHYRFQITDQNSIFFYHSEKEKITTIWSGQITTSTNYTSARLIINMDPPVHHILTDNPTTYRSTWDFYLVFKSPNFHNVFFKKGKWKPLK